LALAGILSAFEQTSEDRNRNVHPGDERPVANAPADEEGRLAALDELHVLGTPAEDRFDRVTRLSSRLFGVPMAAVTLVAKDRWLTKSRVGLTVSETARSQSFCDTAIRLPEMLVVEDTQADERFRTNPLVEGDPHIRFYAGQPLEVAGGHRVGTLCILDQKPRTLSDADKALLRDMALWVQKELMIDEELERAADVQRGLLPRSAPAVPGYDVGGACLPSRAVGGDLFDWYTTVDGLTVTVADVMGKGMPAAIVMATLRAVLRAATRSGDLMGAVEAASSTIDADFDGAGVFATLFHARLDPARCQISYVDAGHGLARVVRADGAVEHPSRRGLPVGALPGFTWEEDSVCLEAGDALVVFSDGLLDLHPNVAAVDAEIAAALGSSATAAATVERLLGPASGGDREDDVTVVVVRRTS
jgi:hypothetical protein